MIALRHASTGEIQFVTARAGYCEEWQSYGPVLPASADPTDLVLINNVWVLDAAKVEAELVLEVKREANRRKMAVRSPGTAKEAEYRQKKAEGAASASLLPAVLNALTAANALAQYPAAMTERKLTGESLSSILARYRAAAAASDAEGYRLSAIEADAVAKIKAASTAAAKRAAYAAINWTWQPA